MVGTRGAEIVEFDQSDQPSIYMRGHWDSELWGLAVHPKKAEIFTVGRDALLARWDLKKKKQILHTTLKEGAADAIAISNNAQFLAIGFQNGAFQVLNTEDLKTIKTRRDRTGNRK